MSSPTVSPVKQIFNLLEFQSVADLFRLFLANTKTKNIILENKWLCNYFDESGGIMNNKKLLYLLSALLLLVFTLTGCDSNSTADSVTEEKTDDNKVKIVTTIFPEYDWVRNIVGYDNENVEVTLLLKNGVDLHSYQPTAQDLVAISEADVFVYVGGHSDVWVANALKNVSNPNQITVNLFESLDSTLKPLRMSEGMEHSHHQDEDEHVHNKDEYDEHIWLSLTRAQKAVDTIAEAISDADPENADFYMANSLKYQEELNLLDKEYREVVSTGEKNTLIFADRFPFFYMADDYGIDYYAAFSGCSAESEASFETIIFLANKVDELNIDNLITIENRTHKIPETIIENTETKNQGILVLNSLQSVTEKQISEGMTYLNVMKDNLQTIETALN